MEKRKILEWRERRGKYYAESERGMALSYAVYPKRNGKFWLEARGLGGGKIDVHAPFEFNSAQAAMDWAENREQEAESRPADRPVRL
jgi:hypothetical protein